MNEGIRQYRESMSVLTKIATQNDQTNNELNAKLTATHKNLRLYKARCNDLSELSHKLEEELRRLLKERDALKKENKMLVDEANALHAAIHATNYAMADRNASVLHCVNLVENESKFEEPGGGPIVRPAEKIPALAAVTNGAAASTANDSQGTKPSASTTAAKAPSSPQATAATHPVPFPKVTVAARADNTATKPATPSAPRQVTPVAAPAEQLSMEQIEEDMLDLEAIERDISDLMNSTRDLISPSATAA